MSEWHYHYAGISVTSALELPEWSSFRTAPTKHETDVVIRQTAATAPCNTYALAADDTALSFTLPKIGHYQIIDGREIVLTPHAEADAAALRLFLLGSAWGAVGYQRGWLPLHASVVQVGDGAVAFCAPSGHGKSSLAAWLTQQSYTLVSDDLCRLDVTRDQAPCVWPSIPRLKLWQDALRELAWQTPVLCRDLLRIDKFHLAAPGIEKPRDALRATVPLRAIYLLAWGNLAVEPLTGLDAVRAVIEAASYRPEFITAMGQSASYWQQMITLMDHVPVFRLYRPRDWAIMPDVGMLLLDHINRTNL
jgi:hypothetical protein